MKTRIKIHKTNGDHHGYIEWIEKLDLETYRLKTEEWQRTNEERWKTFTKSPRETSRKRYGSASAWIFFTETIFLTNFKWILNTRRVERICSALFPLFIGEKREVVAAQHAQASWVASTRRHRLLLEHPGRPKWAWLLFTHPFLLNTPPLLFFGDSFFVKLRKLTNFVTILVFFP